MNQPEVGTIYSPSTDTNKCVTFVSFDRCPPCVRLRSKSQCNECQLEDFLLKTFAEKTWLHPFPYYLFISSQFPHFLRKDLVVSCFGFQGTQPAKDCLVWKKVNIVNITQEVQTQTRVRDTDKSREKSTNTSTHNPEKM